MRFRNLGKVVAGAALGLTLAFTSVTPALAATITINNAAVGETYTAYKLFDVTRGAGKDTIPGNEDDTYAYYTDNEELVSKLQQAHDLDLVFTKAASGDVWYVSGLDDAHEAAGLAEFIHNNWDVDVNFSTVLEDGLGAENGTITTEDPGYYFVTSSLGSLCALNTAADSVQINEKNAKPSINKKVWEDSKGQYVDGEEFATIDVSDEIKYQLTVNTGTGSGLGTGVDADYVITDALPAGITFIDDSVTIGDWNAETDYNVNYVAETNTLTITLHQSKLATIGENHDIVIEYKADADGELSMGDLHTNTVTLSYKQQKVSDSASVKTYGLGGTADGTPTITKVDGDNNETKLPGVKFVLQNNTTGKFATFNSAHYLTGWVDNQQKATPLVTDENGNIFAYGLDADTYILTETETLPGYNLLNDTITADIDVDGNVTYQYTSEVDDDDPNTNAGSSIMIENHAGSLLPSTGGMGTTALYAVGAVLVVGAGVTLVVRRRAHHEA